MNYINWKQKHICEILCLFFLSFNSQITNGFGQDDKMSGCRLGFWRCYSGQCIPNYYRCDKYIDCYDKSDEVNCFTMKTTQKPGCPNGQFTCWNGKCIASSLRCNGRNDCGENSDEFNCNSTSKTTIKYLPTFFTSTSSTRPTTSTSTRSISFSTTSTTTRLSTSSTTTKPRNVRQCGIPAITPITSNTRVVGGVPAKPHSWPWQISLRKKNSFNQNYHTCGGSILNETVIITAAHCLGGSNISSDYLVVAGDHDQTTEADGQTQIRGVAKLISHDRYNSKIEPSPNDIALLLLSSPLQFNDHISPVCLPTTNIQSGENCYSTGWGETENTGVKTTLNQARVPVINLATCQRLNGYSLVLDSMICAGYLAGRVDTCQGDSGGPFVCKSPADNKWYLDGIVAWGVGCADFNSPGVYTRTFSFLDWIKQLSGLTP